MANNKKNRKLALYLSYLLVISVFLFSIYSFNSVIFTGKMVKVTGRETATLQFEVTSESTAIWINLTKPEGIYYFASTPQPDAGNYQYNFSIVFTNIIASAGNIIGCYINESNCYDETLGGCTQIFVNSTLSSSVTRVDQNVTYNLKQTDSINTTLTGTTDNWIPWRIIKCGVYESDMTPIYEENVTWRIHVHPTNWTTGDIANSVNGKTAANMFLENTIKTDNQGDVAFSVAKYGGTKVEQECSDGIDNSEESDSLADCSDPDCYGITYSCLVKQDFTNSSLYYSPSGSHGTLATNIPAGDVADNTSSSTTFSTKVQYTMHTMPNGTMKFRLSKWGLSKTATFFIDGLPRVGHVNKYAPGNDADHGLMLYFLDKNGDPVSGNSLDITQANNTRIGLRSYLAGGTEIANLDTVLNITFANPTNISMSEGYVLTVTVNYVEGTTTYEETMNVTAYFDDPTYNGGAGTRWNSTNEKENDIKVAGTNWGPCNDSINGDFDFLNCLENEQYCFSQSSYDCYDLDCNQLNGPVAWNAFRSINTTGLCGYYNESQTVSMCFDGYNNDWAREDNTSGEQNSALSKVDCRDTDCDGVSNTSFTCELDVELTCNDGFDNDMYNLKDCQQQSGGGYNNAEYDCASYCRSNTGNSTETGTQCDDNMDNDWDLWYKTTGGASGYSYNTTGGMDCAWTTNHPDNDCNLSTMGNGKRCELAHELTCNDNFDNDYDNGYSEPSPGWTSTVYNAYFGQFGLSYAANADYNDYDCRRGANVPHNESMNTSWCFDSIDNDLDAYYWSTANWTTNSSTGKDCYDADCLRISNPSNANQTCLSKEYDATDTFFAGLSSIDFYCKNGYDDDADSTTDCYDTDCNKQFNLCYACPTTENVTWDACADSEDNDYADGTDCADSDCVGYLMDYDHHMCVAASGENTAFLCSDGADNDADGSTDCADSNCNGVGACQTTETNCNDDIDNDNDGNIDCVDSDCASIGICNITTNFVGTYVAPTTSTSTFGVVQVTWDSRVRKGDNYSVNIYKATSYSTANLYIGRLTGSGLPTANGLVGKNFAIIGTDAANFETSQYNTASSKGQIEVLDQTPGTSQSGFDITVEIPTNATLDSTNFEYYHSIDGSTSTGNTIGVIILDNIVPTIDNVITEPGNKNSIGYGSSIWVGVNTSDAENGDPYDGSIDRCYYNVSGPGGYYTSGEDATDCKFTFTNLTDDGSYTLNVWARDNTGNLGLTTSNSYTVDINPTYIDNSFSLSSHWYQSGNSITVSAQFYSDDASSIAACYAYYRNSQGVVSSATSTSISSSGDKITCSGTVSAPSADEMYELWINITDTEGDTVKADSETFYVCGSNTSAGTGINGEIWSCALRDMDNDGTVGACEATAEIAEVVTGTPSEDIPSIPATIFPPGPVTPPVPPVIVPPQVITEEVVSYPDSSPVEQTSGGKIELTDLPTTNSQFTDFDYLFGVRPLENKNYTLNLGWVCAGPRYALFKCENWDYENGICLGDKTDWKVYKWLPVGLHYINVTLAPNDPGLGIGPSPYSPYCGDGYCDSNEDSGSCPIDCGNAVGQSFFGVLFSNMMVRFGFTTGAVVSASGDCVEDWQCTQWTRWNAQGIRTRRCADSSSCGTTYEMPATSDTCKWAQLTMETPAPTFQFTDYIIVLIILLLFILIIVIIRYFGRKHRSKRKLRHRLLRRSAHNKHKYN
jgi:hypothetical protein